MVRCLLAVAVEMNTVVVEAGVGRICASTLVCSPARGQLAPLCWHVSQEPLPSAAKSTINGNGNINSSAHGQVYRAELLKLSTWTKGSNASRGGSIDFETSEENSQKKSHRRTAADGHAHIGTATQDISPIVIQQDARCGSRMIEG